MAECEQTTTLVPDLYNVPVLAERPTLVDRSAAHFYFIFVRV